MQDLRLAFRTLFARPAFSAVAIITLALGIGANAAVFTVFHAVLLAPLPYADPSAVVILNEQTPQFPTLSVTRFNYEDWRARAKSFSGMAAFRATNMTLSGAGDPERVPAKMISANLLPLLGIDDRAWPRLQRRGRPSRRRRGRNRQHGVREPQVCRCATGRTHAATRQPSVHHRRSPAADLRAVPAC